MPINKEKHRVYARAAGTMYIICMITSIVGGLLIQKALESQTLVQALERNLNLLIIGNIFEFINAFGVIIIAISFYHMLKIQKPALSTTYLITRSIEASFCIGAAFLPILSLLSIHNTGLDAKQKTILITFLSLSRSSFFDYLYPILFTFAGILFYSLLYTTKQLPRYLSIWGLLSLIGVLMSILVPDIKMIPGLFIIANELYLGFYLLLKSK
ncbi:MAG: hypothetical protein PWP24_1805 [Clostridiales bacterium]|nr:hypothetical protein [Clostridiales bacterium]